MPVTEFNQEMGSELSDEWGETIGGLLLHHYGELPPQGDKIEIDRFRFIVTEVEENRIKTVEFEKISEPPQSNGQSPEGSEDKI